MEKYTYEMFNEGTPQEILSRSDGAWIPTHTANSDYQHYLKWLENPDAEEVTPMFDLTTEPPTEQTQEGEE